MATQHIEFGLGEFALYEFAREVGAAYAETEFFVTGSSAFNPGGQALYLARAESSASSYSDIITQTVLGASISLSGTAISDLKTVLVRAADVSSSGVGTVNIGTNRAVMALMSASGSSATNIQSFDGIETNMSGSSSAIFYSSASAVASLAIAAASSASILGGAIVQMGMTISGQDDVQFDGGTAVAARMISVASADTDLKGSSLAAVVMQSGGSSLFSPSGGQIVNARMLSSGSASLVLDSGYRLYVDTDATSIATSTATILTTSRIYAYAILNSSGVAESDLQAERRVLVYADMAGSGSSSTILLPQLVLVSEFAASGQSTADFERGRGLVSNMPFAFDATVRPIEIRIAEWTE